MRIRVALLAGLVALLYLGQAQSAELSQTVRFSPHDLTFSQSAGLSLCT